MRRTLLILLPMVLSLAGCNRADTSPKTEGPAANAPVPNILMRISEGTDLAQVTNPALIRPQFTLSPPEVPAAIIFAVVRSDAGTGAPVILQYQTATLPASWRFVQLRSSVRQEWVYAAACPPRHELWAVLDDAAEVKSWQLTLLRSDDDGATWQYFSGIKKPANTAEFAGFAMARDGHGRLTMHLGEDADNQSHGYYNYFTTDGGKTWTGPTHEGNDVHEAQPSASNDALSDAIKDALALPSQ